MRLHAAAQGIAIALESLRLAKLRSALTILGVVIGVTTVMAMASIVQGIRSQILTSLETAGPRVFYVMRFFSQTPLNPNNLPYEVRIRPVLRSTDAAAIAAAPGIAYAGMWAQLFTRMEYLGTHTQAVTLFGADDSYMDIQGGTLLSGRFFTPGELKGTQVIVLEQEIADHLFGRVDPLGRTIRAAGVPLRVVGIYQKPANLFEPPGQQVGGIVPFETAHRYFQYDETNGVFIAVKPHSTIGVPEGKDAAITALRRVRRLHPADPNTFDLITQDQILDIVGKFTTYFFVAMIALSSVALLVGGIGVMATMMVSVTDRTREVGLRKALGADRQDILWQFLVEAATLTATGGLLGIVVGSGAGELLKLTLGLTSGVPIWSAAVAVGVSVAIGLIFGVLPAVRAARMDPVEALRHE